MTRSRATRTAEYLIPCLETHKPIDLVIIMLGTNDLKMRFSVPACDIAAGARVLVDIFDLSEHRKLGEVVAARVRRML